MWRAARIAIWLTKNASGPTRTPGRQRYRICHRLDRRPEFNQRAYKASSAHLPNARAYSRNPEPRAERVERLTPSVLLLQIDGLVMPSLVELCAPHLVHSLVVGPAEDHGRAEPNVEVAQIFQSPD
jgi:hypothetical protein